MIICSDKKCRGELRVTHTYAVSDRKYQRATCSACSKVYRLETNAVPVNKRGDGARAHANKLAIELP
jgi:hypothetical protein